MDNEQKNHMADLHHRILVELKQVSDIKYSLKYCSSLEKLKTEIELCLETVQKLYTKTKVFNISEEEIKEVETLLSKYLDAIYEEIANNIVDKEIEEVLSL